MDASGQDRSVPARRAGNRWWAARPGDADRPWTPRGGPTGQGHAVPGVAPPAIELEQVTTRRGGRAILDGVNLRVPAGHITAIMGPSGSGKTVLASHVAGELRPDAGRVLVDGRPQWDEVPEGLSPAVRRCGLLFGSNRTYDRFIDRSLTVLDNLATVLVPVLGDPARAARRAAGHAHAWSLDEVAGLPAGDLDSITRHRLCLAHAFAGDPALVIVDDPSWAVDINHVDAEIAAIRQWRWRTGGTLLLTTHSLMFAKALADQLVVLRTAAVVTVGPTAEVLRGVTDDDGFERRFGGRLSVRESDVERLRALGTDEVRWGGSYLDIQRPLSRRDRQFR